MNKISKREKILLVVLFVFVFSFGYFKFILVPQENHLKELEQVKLDKQNELTNMLSKIKEKPRIEERIKDLTETINGISSRYYAQLNQEDYIVLLSSLDTYDNFEIQSFSFSDNSTRYDTRDVLTTEIEYQGYYEELLKYIDTLENYNKTIAAKTIEMTTESDNYVTGKLIVEFNAIPALSDYMSDESFFEINGTLVDKRTGSPYSKYESLAAKDKVNDELATGEMTQSELYLSTRTVNPIYGFEDDNYFFVGDSDVTGEVSQSMNRMYGEKSGKLKYNYGVKKAGTEANLVLEDKIIIDRESDYLSLWAYSYEETGHKMGIVLIDSTGDAYDLTLSDSVNWREWRVLEVELPLEITYPCKIQRVYLQSTDYAQQKSGLIDIDQIQLADEKLVENKDE